MMYQKAMCFCDQTIAKKILTTHDVAQVKKFGRQVSNYNENRWNGIRQIVVYEGLLAKFSQNLNLKDLLKATGDNLLAECAVKDKIWGVGLSMSDPDRLDITKWKGSKLIRLLLNDGTRKDMKIKQSSKKGLLPVHTGSKPFFIQFFMKGMIYL